MTCRRFPRQAVHQGPLIVVNARHPLQSGAAGKLAPVDARHPDILLEAAAGRLLAA